MLQFKTRHCNGILLRGFDISEAGKFVIPETIFKRCLAWAKVTFLFMSTDVKVNVGFINHALGKGQVSLLRQLQLLRWLAWLIWNWFLRTNVFIIW